MVFCPLLAREIVPAAIKNPPLGGGDKKIVEKKGPARNTRGNPFFSAAKKGNKSGESFCAGFYLLWRFAKVGIFDLAGSRYFCLLSNLIFAHFLKKTYFSP